MNIFLSSKGSGTTLFVVPATCGNFCIADCSNSVLLDPKIQIFQAPSSCCMLDQSVDNIVPWPQIIGLSLLWKPSEDGGGFGFGRGGLAGLGGILELLCRYSNSCRYCFIVVVLEGSEFWKGCLVNMWLQDLNVLLNVLLNVVVIEIYKKIGLERYLVYSAVRGQLRFASTVHPL